jgi:hypothetical protein
MPIRRCKTNKDMSLLNQSGQTLLFDVVLSLLGNTAWKGVACGLMALILGVLYAAVLVMPCGAR